jgi:hypothetical protein
MAEVVPDQVRAFVRSYLRSMLQLEALLLLAREPQRWWSARSLGLELRAAPEASAAQLERLSELGLLVSQGGPDKEFRFEPRDSAHVAIVAALSDMHRDRFHAVVDLLYARDRAQVFADAFKLKKSGDDDG